MKLGVVAGFARICKKEGYFATSIRQKNFRSTLLKEGFFRRFLQSRCLKVKKNVEAPDLSERRRSLAMSKFLKLSSHDTFLKTLFPPLPFPMVASLNRFVEHHCVGLRSSFTCPFFLLVCIVINFFSDYFFSYCCS